MCKYLVRSLCIIISILYFNPIIAQNIPSQELSYKVFTLSEIKRPISVKALPDYNLLIVTDGSAGLNEPTLYAYTLDSIRFLKSFITVGDGSNQVNTPGAVQYFTGERVIRMFDVNMQRFCEIPIDAILKTGAQVPINRYMGRDSLTKKIRFNNFALKAPYVLPKGKEMVELNSLLNAPFQFLLKDEPGSKTDPDVFKILSSSGALKSENGRLPNEIVEEVEKSAINRFAGVLDLNDKGDIAIYRSYFANFIALYNLKGELLAYRYGTPENDGPNDKHTLFIGENNWAYLSVVARMHKNEVYAINVHPKNHLGEDGKKLLNLYVFDKALKPQKRLLIRGGEISFDVNPETGRIYSLDNKQLYVSFQ